MNRRDFLCGVAASVVALRSGHVSAVNYQQTTLPLWPRMAPGGGGPSGSAILSAKGALSNIAVPALTVLTPEDPNGHAVLIAAGGGYKRIQMASEAWPAAQWLAARGYTAYILSYRLPHEGWVDGNMVSLQDAQRALRIIRQREQHLSVLGFSAGGHLLGLAITRTGFASYAPQDKLDSLPAYADRAALIYPIITLEKPYSHSSTHRLLVGPHASAADNAAWSVQNYVNAHTPPLFLVQALDDPISNPDNTLIMSAACRKAAVPVEMYRYADGGHGFGMGRAGTATMQWPSHYKTWLERTR
ncbi:alpha/beta hydrolase [Erwiniaceae bacterium BAC15a-03b]|uniref:Alpha/beta hydrolase n=1 Tax=Winslowiella arboricola TaxID=2978220 RepID=A0A9J6PSW1_9GAMM|nr:alpha/beta hydrolase [Winslowiella arboricola]MCU5773174.1 alpha/beta hydrolase [Winslowiella arboricola]MCU5778757.1 alpha/beta hydrolase [Winslowiella arboricola]